MTVRVALRAANMLQSKTVGDRVPSKFCGVTSSCIQIHQGRKQGARRKSWSGCSQEDLVSARAERSYRMAGVCAGAESSKQHVQGATIRGSEKSKSRQSQLCAMGLCLGLDVPDSGPRI